MMYDPSEVGKRIQQVRMRQGYTQEEFAEKLNIERSFVSKLERGEKSPSVDILVLISSTFDITTDYLLLGKSDALHITKKQILKIIEILQQFVDSL